jgi:hypothetical protein
VFALRQRNSELQAALDATRQRRAALELAEVEGVRALQALLEKAAQQSQEGLALESSAAEIKLAEIAAVAAQTLREATLLQAAEEVGRKAEEALSELPELTTREEGETKETRNT